MTQVAGRTLENIIGPLTESFPQLDHSTIQHGAQIHNDRINAEEPLRTELRSASFYTADFALYRVKENGVILYLAKGEDNLIFDNIGEATAQLLKTKNYVPCKEGIDKVVKSVTIVRINLSNVRLKELEGVEAFKGEISYLEIDTNNYANLNEDEKKLAGVIYGQGNEFQKNMNSLNENGIKQARICVLNPGYVRENAPQYGAIARACRLSFFECDAGFDAAGRSVGNRSFHLRGVPNTATANYSTNQPKQ
ncbi:MAG: hypothetical protein AABX34_00130 [Nanoarchaeota archaeon]